MPASERASIQAALGNHRPVDLRTLCRATANGRGSRGGTQLALPLEPPAAPELEPLGEWGEVRTADYRTTGMVLGSHPMELMRPELDRTILRSSDLQRTADGASVEVAGLVSPPASGRRRRRASSSC